MYLSVTKIWFILRKEHIVCTVIDTFEMQLILLVKAQSHIMSIKQLQDVFYDGLRHESLGIVAFYSCLQILTNHLRYKVLI